MKNRCIVYVLCLAVLNLGSPLVAQAGIVTTLQAVEASTRSQDVATVSAALLLGAALAWWRLAREAERFPRLMGVALLAILTANPYAYFYDAVLAMPAGVLLWTGSSSWRSPLLRRWALAASLATYLWMLAQYLALLGNGPSLAGVGLTAWLALEDVGERHCPHSAIAGGCLRFSDRGPGPPDGAAG